MGLQDLTVDEKSEMRLIVYRILSLHRLYHLFEPATKPQQVLERQLISECQQLYDFIKSKLVSP